MDCDVDIHAFAAVPYVLERPAAADALADAAQQLLARAGFRIEFGKAKDVARSGEALVADSLPVGVGLIGRDGSVRASAGVTATLVSGAARASPHAKSPQPAISMAAEGWKMLGHALAGTDRATASAFSALVAMKFGATPQTLAALAESGALERASKAWNIAARMPAYVEAGMARLEASLGFRTADARALAKAAARIARASLTREEASTNVELTATERFVADIRARLVNGGGGRRVGRRFASDLGDTFSGRPLLDDTPEPDEPEVAFEVHPFGTEPYGPSWLPAERFNEESLRIVQGVHPDLLRVVARAAEICDQDFQVVPNNGGVRSQAEQHRLKNKGASRAVTGRHTFGYAIDLVPVDSDGKVDFENLDGFDSIKRAMKQAATELNVPIEWGGSWKKLVDMPHFELNRHVYPGPREHAKPEGVLVAFKG